jgi:pimeloyl-ACP methyl ester carboxylesterase
LSQTPNTTLGPAGRVRLPDGRSVTFAVAGPEDGFPVLYCHGAIGSPRWRTPGLDTAIERLSIRYLVLNRPGFGGSDPKPGRLVIDFARDAGDAMSVLGYPRFSVVGVSAGAPYALACGSALPERIVALAAVSPLVPPDGLGASTSLRYRVPLVPFGLAGVGPALAHLSLAGFGLHPDTSARAMIDDYLVCRRPWGFDPAGMRIPVTVLARPRRSARPARSHPPACRGDPRVRGARRSRRRALRGRRCVVLLRCQAALGPAMKG